MRNPVKKPDAIIISGGNVLKGSVSAQGSKNATLPILAASYLFKERVILHNVPDIADVRSFLDILHYLGVQYTFEQGTLDMDCRNISNSRIPDTLSRRLRASSLLLGPSLARYGKCEIGMPGGCSIGPRPLNYHFNGFERLGATLTTTNGMIQATTEGGLKGEHTLEFQSVGATQNLIMASVYGNETVVLKNIAKEPEIIDMIEFLRAGGAKIKLFPNSADVEIQGVERLDTVEYQIQPDRIEAGTLLVCGAITKGDVTVTNVIPEHLSAVTEKFEEMGLGVETTTNSIRVYHKGEFKGVNIKTGIYPGFPTDMQPQMVVLLTQANKSSMLVEAIFNNRYQYVDELRRLNADIQLEGSVANIEPTELSGCPVEGFDLRATAAMIIAGLCAKDVTKVSQLEHLHRGYECFIEKLRELGADIGEI